MSRRTYEVNPAETITVGAVGPPGERVFYIQARSPEATVTLVTEKGQVQLLAQGVYQLLVEVNERYAMPTEHTPASTLAMELENPLEPEFRVERMELMYDPASDLVELLAYELLDEDPEEEDLPARPDLVSEARFYATRAQMHALADHAMEVVARGRPLCPLCGQAEGPDGHVCPKRNGHLHLPDVS